LTKLAIRGVHVVKAKGRTYTYAWRGGPRLLEVAGTNAFLQELLAARICRLDGVVLTRIEHLVTGYRASPAWLSDVSATTQKNWLPWLDRIIGHFGKLPIRSFDEPAAVVGIRSWRDQFRATPRAADMAKQVLSRLLSFAAEEGLLTNNPCSKIPNLYRASRAAIIWTPGDLETLARHASHEVMWAARLAGLSGLRRGDLLRLTWADVHENFLEVGANKSRQRGGAIQRTSLVPVYSELRAHMAVIPRRSTVVLTNSAGQPWSGGFGSTFAKAKAAAGLSHLHFHDLRGTAATRFRLAGFTDKEIAETLAWSEGKLKGIIDRYVRRDAVMRDRIERLGKNQLRA